MKRLGAEVLAEMLSGYGVSHVFMVPAVVRRTFVEMERRTQIKRIHCHGEKAAAYMADGYARASGKPGVCMAQVIGALNLAAGLRDAWLARSPIIAVTGGRDPKTKFRGVYQEVDDMPAFEPVTKYNATVDDVARIPGHAEACLPRRRQRVARPRAPPVPRQRGPARRRGSGDGAARRAAVRRGAALAPGRDEKDLKALLEQLESAAARHRRRRRRARLARGRRARRFAEALHDPRRDVAQRQGQHSGHASPFGRRGRHLLARERRTASSRARTSSFSSARAPAA